jgi:putative transposase
MREPSIRAVQLLATVAKLLRPGGIRAVAAESLLLQHQLIVSSRARRRAPELTSLDRFVLGLTSLFVNPHRIAKPAAIVAMKTRNPRFGQLRIAQQISHASASRSTASH